LQTKGINLILVVKQDGLYTSCFDTFKSIQKKIFMKEGVQYSLSIRFSSDGFSLSIYNELDKLLSVRKVTTALFKTTSEDIVKLLTEETETFLNMKSTRVICETDLYTLVPAAIFKAEEASLYLNFHDKRDKTDRILFNRLSQRDIVNVFSIPNALNVAINQLYPGSTIEHHISWFFNEKLNRQTDNSVHIWVRPEVMDVVVLTNRNVILANSFAYETSEDFVYFTLNIFDQLVLNKDEYKIKLYNTKNQTDIQDCLKKYIKCCQTME